jgi:hypothetical protein
MTPEEQAAAAQGGGQLGVTVTDADGNVVQASPPPDVDVTDIGHINIEGETLPQIEAALVANQGRPVHLHGGHEELDALRYLMRRHPNIQHVEALEEPAAVPEEKEA